MWYPGWESNPQKLRSERSGYAGSPTGACFQMKEGEGIEPSCLMAWPGFRNRLPPAGATFHVFLTQTRSPLLSGGTDGNRTRITDVTSRRVGRYTTTPNSWWSRRASPSSAKARDNEDRRRHRMVEPPGIEPGPRGCKPRTLPLRHGPTSSGWPGAGHKKTRHCRVSYS
jgi:hypothetical protein